MNDLHFVAEGASLGAAAAFAARHTAGTVPVPALSGLRLSADRPGTADLRLCGYDYEAGTLVRLEVEVAEPGEILVPGRVFAEVTQALPANKVEVVAGDSGVTITADAIEFVLPTLPLDEFPTLPEAPPTAGTTATGLFTRAVARLAKIAARDDVVPIFSGTLLEFDAGILTMAASDRYRLAICELDWDGDDTGPVVVPARLLAEAAKGMVSGGDLEVGVADHAGRSEALLGLSDGRRTTTMRLLDGHYPAMRSKVPSDFLGTIVVDTGELRTALRRVCLVADRYAAVVLQIAEGSLTVQAAGDAETRGRERVAVRLDGEGTTTAFNAGYLQDGLDFVDSPYVRIGFQAGIRPTLLTPVDTVDGTPPERPGTQYVVLPRRLPG